MNFLTPIVTSLLIITAAPLLHAQSQGQETAGDEKLEVVVVTATGGEKNKDELAESVTLFDKTIIETISPSHPSELLNRSSGVYINNLGGEGHMTSIRQPISTKGVYLFLEDGIPTRPSGFFNHNGLYEVNIPQSGSIEVIKGPATALYGSEAIGGVINSLTEAPSDSLATMLNVEGGSDGWQRALLSNSNTIGDQAYRINVNATKSDGYRDDSEFDRQSFTTRWDINKESLLVKTLLSTTKVEQSGSSSLNKYDYKNNPEKNVYKRDVGGRDIEASRLSSEFIIGLNEDQQLELTPFYRVNTSTMMPSWMVTYDPNVRETNFETIGLLSKFRQAYTDIDGELVVGIDVDHSPSEYVEYQVNMKVQNIEGDNYYLDYTKTGLRFYDLDAKQNVISPFAQFDMALTDQWRFSAGLRYDYFSVDYQDNLVGQAVDSNHIRAESQKISYDSWSPKLGVIYQYSANHNAYANYRHAFRAPTVGELFRSGKSTQSSELEPVKADSTELGFRGYVNNALQYETAIYYMIKRDDIVSVITNADRETINAGETQHKGIELTLLGSLTNELSYNMAVTYTEQRYEKFEYIFQCFSPSCGSTGMPIIETRNYNGNDIALAPETIANTSIAYSPSGLDGLRVELEWEHLGEYYTDDNNSDKYGGHDLFNIRGNYRVNERVELYARIQNLGNTLYSTRTSKSVTAAENDYRPGTPRSYYAGIRVKF